MDRRINISPSAWCKNERFKNVVYTKPQLYSAAHYIMKAAIKVQPHVLSHNSNHKTYFIRTDNRQAAELFQRREKKRFG